MRREAKLQLRSPSKSAPMLGAATFAFWAGAFVLGGCVSSEDRSVHEAYIHNQNESTSQPESDPRVIRLGMTRQRVKEIARNRYSRISRDKSTLQMYRYAFPGTWEYWLYFQRSRSDESDEDLLEAIISRQLYVALP